jgi:hypothetical protein
VRARLTVVIVLAVLAILGSLLLGPVERGSFSPPPTTARPPRVVEPWAARPGPFGEGGVHNAYASLRCTVDDVVIAEDGDAGELWAIDEAGHAHSATLERGVFLLSLVPGKWSMAWDRGDRVTMLGDVVAEEGGVLACVLANSWTIEGRVLNPYGQPVVGARVVGCGTGTVSEEGGEFMVATAQGHCTLAAWWWDGALSRPGTEIVVTPFSAHTELELVVDDREIAGLGIGLEPGDGVIGVSRVLPGSPAEREGIEPGDVILAIDGESTEYLEVEDFRERALGTVGSTVMLVLVGEDGERRVRLRRERIAEAPGEAMVELGEVDAGR